VPDGLSTATPAAQHRDVEAPATGAEAAREESTGVFWVLVGGGLLFVVAGWLLPWFVELTSNGIGASPQDALTQLFSGGPTGIGSFLVLLMGLAMIAVLAGAGYDIAAATTKRWGPFRFTLWQGIAAAVGLACAVAVWALIGVAREEPLFGSISPLAQTDNAVWITITGFAVLAVAYLFRDFVVRHSGIAFTGVAFIVGGLFPLIFNQSTSFIGWGASIAAIYVLLALGLNVVVGFAGLLDLGYAAFFAIGAYTTASLNSPRHGIYLSFWLIIFIGAAVAALFGAILGAPTLRLRGDYLAIVTLGFGEIIPDMANNDFLSKTGGPNGITGIHHPNLFGYDFGLDSRSYFWALLVVIALAVVALRNLEHSRLGRAWIAIREDEIAANATGINTITTKLLAFSIGASVSGFAGAFFGAYLGIVTPEDFEFAVSVTVLSMVVLGGIGNTTGVSMGGLLIAFVIFWVLPHAQEWTSTLGTTTGVTSLSSIDFSKYKFILYGIVLVTVMLLRPGGLLPSRARRVELQAGIESEALAAVQGKA
jgi:branched-chain amino acid transport system permease protein